MSLDSNAVITLCLFMVVHLCGTVWWMAKVNTTLGFIGQQVADIVKTIAAHEATYAKKSDCERIERSVEALWKRVDEMK